MSRNIVLHNSKSTTTMNGEWWLDVIKHYLTVISFVLLMTTSIFFATSFKRSGLCSKMVPSPPQLYKRKFLSLSSSEEINEVSSTLKGSENRLLIATTRNLCYTQVLRWRTPRQWINWFLVIYSWNIASKYGIISQYRINANQASRMLRNIMHV